MEQPELLRFIIEQLEQLAIQYMVVGSYASSAYGETRFTNDIDIVVEMSADQLRALIAKLPAQDFYVSEEAALAALRAKGQFNVIHPESGNKIDFMVARADAWGREQLRNRQRIELLTGLDVFAARPEDIILSKMLYYSEGGSEKHLRDITGIFRASGANIDRGYVQRYAQELGLLDVWDAVLKRISA